MNLEVRLFYQPANLIIVLTLVCDVRAGVFEYIILTKMSVDNILYYSVHMLLSL